MPELPEVENFRGRLHDRLSGKPLENLIVHDSFLLKNCDKSDLQDVLPGTTLNAVKRRGKYLLFSFQEYILLNHLRMSGRWALEKGDRTRLTLQFCKESVFLEDLRRLGTLHLYHESELNNCDPLADMGVEPLSDQFTDHKLQSLCCTNRELKRLLVDQKRIAGLGNIYSCEALFRAGLHPCRSASSLTDQEVHELRTSIQQTLREAVKHEGTSFDQLYKTASGKPGQFQHLLNVYDREGELCTECDSQVKRIKQGQRSSYLCENCQE